MQSGDVFHSASARHVAKELLYFWVSTHFQEHFIRFGNGQGLFNEAMLHQNAMIRRGRQRGCVGLRSALVLFSVFHCPMLTRFPSPVISLVLASPNQISTK